MITCSYLARRGGLAAEALGAVHTLPPAVAAGGLVVTETARVEPSPTCHTTHTLRGIIGHQDSS